MPRAGLNPQRVVDEARLLADEVGLSQLTLASLAARLDVRLPSLYKHIDGLDGLHRSLAVRAKVELADVLMTAVAGRAGADAIRAQAHAYRSWAAEHTGQYAATLRSPAPDDEADLAASAAAVAAVATALSSWQLTGDALTHAIRALRAALHGFVALEAAGGFGLPLDIGRSYDVLISMFLSALDSWSGALGDATAGVIAPV